MTKSYGLIAYGCYKAERRWLSGISKAVTLNIPIAVGPSLNIVKPNLLCGELTRLVVSGESTGMILTPNGLPVRKLLAEPPADRRMLDEVEYLNRLMGMLQKDKLFAGCEHNYLGYMTRALSHALGEKFDAKTFMQNVK